MKLGMRGGVVPTLNLGDNTGDTRATVLIYPIDDGREVEKHQNGTGIGEVYPINTLTLGGRPDPVNDARMTMGVGDAGDPQFTLQAAHSHAVAIANTSIVRRLTPTECERLQGFPDSWTKFDAEGNEVTDGHRYKQMGNAVCVNVAEFVVSRLVSIHEKANVVDGNRD